MKTLIFALAIACVALSSNCAAQATASSGLFTLINTIPKSSGFQCFIHNSKETNFITPVGESPAEAAGNGFSTGLIPWNPADGELVAKVPHRSPAALKPFIKPGDTPLIILKAQGASGVSFSLLPKAANHESGFYDAVNLTERPELEMIVDGKKFRLPRGQRVRVSTKKTMKFEVPGGPNDLLESKSPPSHVIVLYGDDQGNIQHMVVADFGA